MPFSIHTVLGKYNPLTYQVKQSQVGITLLVLLFGRKLGLLELLGLCFPGPEAVFGRPG